MRYFTLMALMGFSMIVASPAAYGVEFDVDVSEIVYACKTKATAVADYCIAENESYANECVRYIAVMLDRGYDRLAARAAEKCATSINRHSYQCVCAMRSGCEDCVAILEYLEADPRLISRVESYCAAELCRVRASRDAALAAVAAALNP